MRLPVQLFSVFLVVGPVLGALGCTNGQFGGEIGAEDDGATSEGNGCVEKSKKAIGLTEATSLGFTGQQMVELASGKHSAELSWGEAAPASVELAPAAGRSAISFDVTIDEESLVLVHLEPKENEAGMEGSLAEGPTCRDELRVDATIVVKSDNGAFEDSFEAVLRSSAPRLVETGLAIELGELKGSFDVNVLTPENGKSIQNRLIVGFVPGGVSGTINGTIESVDGETAAASNSNYGHFPIESCETGYLIGADSDFGRELLALVDEPVDFDLTWQNGDVTPFEIESEVGSICYFSNAWSDEETVTLGLRSKVKSDDGRIDGTWSLEGQVELDAAGKPKSLHVMRQAYLAEIFELTEFEAETGISGFGFEDGSQAAYQFGYDIDLATELAATGSFSVFQATPGDCVEQPSVPTEDGGASSPGCTGTDFVELEQATLRASE